MNINRKRVRIVTFDILPDTPNHRFLTKKDLHYQISMIITIKNEAQPHSKSWLQAQGAFVYHWRGLDELDVINEGSESILFFKKH